MDFKYLKYEVKDGIATITLYRPEKRNALGKGIVADLDAALDMASADKSVGALIVTGGEKVFCAGMDIEEMTQVKSPGESFDWWNDCYNIALEKLFNFRVPTIAAVSGYSLAAGFDVAICCDFRICAPTAKFGQLEAQVHLSPGIERLWRLVGMSRAKYLGLTCEIIDANEAYRIGLADKLVKLEDMMPEARKLAARFVALPRESLEKTKNSYLVVPDMEHKAAINWETLLLTHLFDSDDRQAIMKKFLGK